MSCDTIQNSKSMCYIERNVVYECSVYYGVITSGSCVQRDSSVSSFCPLETSVPTSGCVCTIMKWNCRKEGK